MAQHQLDGLVDERHAPHRPGGPQVHDQVAAVSLARAQLLQRVAEHVQVGREILRQFAGTQERHFGAE